MSFFFEMFLFFRNNLIPNDFERNFHVPGSKRCTNKAENYLETDRETDNTKLGGGINWQIGIRIDTNDGGNIYDNSTFSTFMFAHDIVSQ